MANKEATARIKINKLLEEAGWRFFPENGKPANISLEAGTTIKPAELDALGQDFEHSKKGFIDFLLLDAKKFPLIVLEAKPEDKNPLSAKEQARKYARSLNCRFVLLSNGNMHYFWDLERGNPYIITSFPGPESVLGYGKVTPNPQKLITEQVDEDYIARTLRPNYKSEAGWKNEAERPAFIKNNKLRFLRRYQLAAVHSLQKAVADGKDRFLFEMATGTGKTLVAAAVVKLFLRSGNSRRVLFLVDRLELEEQAKKAFTEYLAADYSCVVYKEKRDEWQKAEIVVTTVQSLLFNNKYQKLFSPTDFDLVISDEAHRSIGGNARAVFDYFIGYKLGLTATPRDYLRKLDTAQLAKDDPRELERRIMLDSYRTFGCEDSHPTFRYSLLDGVKDGVLINPIVVDARTGVTTRLLSEKGFAVIFADESGENQEQIYKQRQYEKRFFSQATNELFCKTFLENALRDPISGEIGKSLVFAVSQNHAAKLTQILNEMADQMFPGKYQSDFAMQVTSHVVDAQDFTRRFANNNLGGSGAFLSEYKTSKTRVCVTVGMMTTGYDCPDILNLALMRPIFSPTEFIQIKGRGTRKHDFRDELRNEDMKADVQQPEKTVFKLFDFFATCEFFEEKFNYDAVIKLPRPGKNTSDDDDDGGGPTLEEYAYRGPDAVTAMTEAAVGLDGMKIDRMFFEHFAETVREDTALSGYVEAGQWDKAMEHVNLQIFNKPEEYYTLEKLRRAAAVDRRPSLREILEVIFDKIPRLKSKNDVLEEEFAKFVADYKPEEVQALPAMKNYFKAYASSNHLRHIIENKEFAALATNAAFSTKDYRAVPEKYRAVIPAYINDYVPLNQFM
jgi:type I restriction enzyme R subunit